MSSLDNVSASADSATTWSSLVPARVQKITVDDATSGRFVLELFAGGKRCLQVRPGRIDVVAERAARDGSTQPPTLQGVLRKELVPSILSGIEHDDVTGLIRIRFVRKDLPGRTLIVETDGRAPRWVLVGGATDDDARILAAEPTARPDDGRDTRRGRPYEPPRRAPAPPVALEAASTSTAAPRGDPRVVQLRQRLRSEHDRLKRLQKALRHDLEKHGDPELLELRGELLKMMMGRLPRGTEGIEIVDFEGVTHAIPLDPAKDAKGNLAALFARARRARAGRTHTAPRVQATEARLAAVAALRARLQADPVDVATDAAVLEAEAFLRAPETGPSARRKAATSGKRQAWRAFAVSDGVVVRVGRGARDNEALVKSAKGHDLWLHARDRTGAHAIIPSTGGVVADDVLLDAAHLAAWFSMGREERNIDIQYTRVKHLKKAGAGSPAGLFLVANETVVHLRVDEARTKRLLAAEVAAG
jgi:predicted ribosome quality control (RQC) complex YloA/Tae2 family protein